MNQIFVSSRPSDSLDKIMVWLNALVGSRNDLGQEITQIIDWHFVHGQRYDEYTAIARVKIE